MFCLIVRLLRANDHRDVAILGHMGMLCGTYVKLHVTMLYVVCCKVIES